VYLENDEASSRSPSQNCSPKSNGKKSDASGDDEQVRSRNEKGSSKTSAKEEKNRKLSISDKSVNSDTHSIHSETENDDDDDEEDSTRSRTENPTHEIQRRLSKTKEKRERQRSSSSNSNDSLHKDSQKVMEIDNEELKNEKDIDNEEDEATSTNRAEPKVITYYCAIQGCRSVEEFECLNKIEEGAYGVVYRAKDKKTHEVVALKRLKMEKEKEGFPITSIREVDTLLKAQHPNVVTVREIVVGSNMDKIYMVMDFVEHDLKSLMQHGMKKPFLMSEVKTLMQQLLRGIAHLHDNWIIHRDLKTSNLLLSHKGVLKIADFGLAREYGSPLKEYTPIVVTLWYRCPELLLNTKKYSTSIDMWSVGCIFGELMLMKALFPGKNEKDQLDKIFKDLGTPTDKIWPGFKELPLTKKLNFAEFPYNTIRSRFGSYLSDKGFELINKLLAYDPVKRMPAEEALKHDFFKETPLPLDSTIFPTWPAKSEGQNRSKSLKDSVQEPKAPSPGKMYEQLLGDAEDGFVLQNPIATGFTLR
jgi:cell division cycle 2-like protein